MPPKMQKRLNQYRKDSLVVYHAFSSIHQDVHRNRVRLLPEPSRPKVGSYVGIAAGSADESATAVKVVSPGQPVRPSGHTDRGTSSFQYLPAEF